MKRVTVLLMLVCLAAFAANPFKPVARGRAASNLNPSVFEVGFWDILPFDPLTEVPTLAAEFVRDAYPGDGTGYYLVQFGGPVNEWQVELLARASGEVVGFHSRTIAFVRMNAAQADDVRRLGFIRWVGVYQPGYKLWSGTLGETGHGRVAVSLFYPEDIARATAELITAGYSIVRTGVSENMKVIEVDCRRGQLADLARRGWVMGVEEWHPSEAENELCQWVVQDWNVNERRIWQQGLFGADEVLGYTDTGLDMSHYAFRDAGVPVTDTGEFPTHRKVVIYRHYPPAGGVGDNDGHGTHVAGTIAGNDSANGGTNVNDGHAKSARIAHLSPIPQPSGDDFTVPLNSITNTLRNPGLRPHTISNSWWTGTMGQYTNAASTFDAFAWRNKDIVLIKSCGNQGQSGQYRITEPGNSKSVVAAAGVQNGTAANQLYTTSSRGPAPDGRIKPDICVPSVNITSAAEGTQNSYVQMSGTSMAAPAVNGSVGLLRSYLRKGYYPSGAANATDTFGYVSAALLKGMLLVSADTGAGGLAVPNEYTGWGRVDLDSVAFFAADIRKLLLDDDTTGLATGEYVEYRFAVTDSMMALRAGVVWTDTAAAAGASPALINDLDCLLTGPGGDFYKGNRYTSGQSTRNPAAAFDALNPLELFRVNRPGPGQWTLRITAANVVTAHQPFAVVVTGALGFEPIHDVGVTAIVAPRGTIDSGTVVAPACSVRNHGNTAESYSVRLHIGDDYDTTATVTAQAPGTTVAVGFPIWTASVPGSFALSCSTELAVDAVPANDRRLDSGVIVVPVRDVGVTAIIAPADTVDSGAVVVPMATVENFGTSEVTCVTWFGIGPSWVRAETVSLAPGVDDTVTFDAWTAPYPGLLATVCYTLLAGDGDPLNDTLRGQVVVLPGTGVGEAEGLPVAFALGEPVPSHFRGTVALRFAAPVPARVELALYNTAGARVRTLVAGQVGAGYQRVTWDGRDDAGRPVSRGIYYCRFETSGQRSMRKMVKLD